MKWLKLLLMVLVYVFLYGCAWHNRGYQEVNKLTCCHQKFGMRYLQ